MIRLFTFCLAFLFAFSAFAQNSNFESVVVEKKTLKPVPNAIVAIEGTELIEKTNDEGVFVFRKAIPFGEHVITISKEGYETNYFLINSEENKQIIVEKIEIEITKAEAKRRKNKEKEDVKRLKAAKKANRAKEKLLAKKAKKLKKKNSVDVAYYDTSKPEPSERVVTKTEPEPIVISEAQLKYSKILGVPVEVLTNRDLYDFIDEWEGVSYLMGGEDKEGIDCSSFTQRLNNKAYNRYIERTAYKQYKSKYNDNFKGKEFLKEGDLMFFKGVGSLNKNKITHVGVYLHNNKFVHATSSKRTEGVSGVKISDLSDNYWSIRFVSGARRINQE